MPVSVYVPCVPMGTLKIYCIEPPIPLDMLHHLVPNATLPSSASRISIKIAEGRECTISVHHWRLQCNSCTRGAEGGCPRAG
jgi:hypothetical protein